MTDSDFPVEWITRCMDLDEQQSPPVLAHYLRLTPDFMDLEAAGFSWGISIGGAFFADELEAIALEAKISRYFDALVRKVTRAQLASLQKQSEPAWTEIRGSDAGGFRVVFYPHFLDHEATEFPDGIMLWQRAPFGAEVEARTAALAVEFFFFCMLEAYFEQLSDLQAPMGPC